MSNFGGPYSAFEKDYAARYKRLNSRLVRLENKLVVIMSNPSMIANPAVLKTNAYWSMIRRDINNVYRDMNKTFSFWVRQELPIRFRQSILDMQYRINSTRAVSETARLGARALANSTASHQIVAGLVADANQAYSQALFAGQKTVTRITRVTQQLLISEQLIDATVAEAFVSGNLRNAPMVLRNALQGVLGAVDEKQFVQAGAKRFTPSYYAEMVSRVKFHEAQSFAALSQGKNYGTSLMQVSSHNTTTAICVPFEGKVYSVSGRDSRFPPLEDTPPYHPNCLHLLYPTFASAMEVQGTLNSFAAFSNDEISRPPTPSGFIPIKKRGIKGVA